jgi:ubiquinone/menaquinone biosynthesis C-methylase UbiE
LMNNGYSVVGMDVSKGMVERAREKGLVDLLLADGTRIPFKAKSFDAALMAHVFHLLEDPVVVLREAARACRVGVFALIRKGGRWPLYGRDQTNADEETKKTFEERRARLRKIFQKYGVEPSEQWSNWRKEEGILETFPPDELRVVSDVVINESVEQRIERFSKGGYSFFSRMPEDMRKEIVDEMRSFWQSIPAEKSIQARHEVYQLALWNSDRVLAS